MFQKLYKINANHYHHFYHHYYNGDPIFANFLSELFNYTKDVFINIVFTHNKTKLNTISNFVISNNRKTVLLLD